MNEERLIAMFVTRLNEARRAAGFTELSHERIAKRLKGRQDLRKLYRECDAARNFSFAFWSRMVPRAYTSKPRLTNPAYETHP